MRLLIRTTAIIAALSIGVPTLADTPTPAQGTLASPKKLAEQARSEISEITSAELEALLKKEASPLLVDVRTEREYQAGHLRGATWIPRGKLEFAIVKLEAESDRDIVLYCRTGGRAALSAKALQEMGYSNVKSLEGGFKRWVEDGNSIFNQHGEIRVVEFEASEEE